MGISSKVELKRQFIDGLLQLLSLCLVHRYCMRAKRIFSELNEKPYVVELDLRGICGCSLSASDMYVLYRLNCIEGPCTRHFLWI